jgi:steroid delta-isomerase-like uncharacterized protein
LISDRQNLVLQFYQAFDDRNFEGAIELLAPNFIAHLAGVAEPLTKEEFQKFGLSFFLAFPDGKHDFEQVLMDGDKVVTAGTFTGTHQLEFQGLPATGKKVKFALMHIDRVADGKIVEHWGQGDQLGLIQQLGIIPVPGIALYPKLAKSILNRLLWRRRT